MPAGLGGHLASPQDTEGFGVIIGRCARAIQWRRRQLAGVSTARLERLPDELLDFGVSKVAVSEKEARPALDEVAVANG